MGVASEGAVESARGEMMRRIASVRQIYAQSFPREEQRSYGDYVRFCEEQPAFHVDLLDEGGGRPVGFIFWWEEADFSYIEHFAVDKAVRGRGMGTRMIGDFVAMHPRTILEIDPPADEVSRRREAFYRRAGFLNCGYRFVHPGYVEGVDPFPLDLMATFSMTGAMCEGFVRYLFERIVPGSVAEGFVRARGGAAYGAAIDAPGGAYWPGANSPATSS